MKITVCVQKDMFDENQMNTLKKFIMFLNGKVELNEDITIKMLKEREGSMTTGSRNSEHELKVLADGRMFIDILRTLAHEWVHEGQSVILGYESGPDIGGMLEDSANALAGIYMKEFVRDNPEVEEVLYENFIKNFVF